MRREPADARQLPEQDQEADQEEVGALEPRAERPRREEGASSGVVIFSTGTRLSAFPFRPASPDRPPERASSGPARPDGVAQAIPSPIHRKPYPTVAAFRNSRQPRAALACRSPGQQALELVRLVRPDHALEHLGEPRLRLDPVELAVATKLATIAQWPAPPSGPANRLVA